MPKATKHKQATWTFIEFANSAEGQLRIARSGRTVPSLKAVAESDAFLDPNSRPATSRVFLDVIPAIRGVPIIETWADIEETAGEEIERAFFGDATVAEAIAAAQERTLKFFPARREKVRR
jgi:multiple sugar transport system substrate-binding protein